MSYVPFQVVHADVWTSPVASFSGFKYYLVLIDDYTHYVWTFPLRAKSEVFQCIKSFHAYVSTQFQLPLLALQTDNGREFDNHALRSHLTAHGAVLRLLCPYTSSQNGKAERIIRTMNDCIRSLLCQANMPDTFWVEALSTATYLLNQRPCQTSGTLTPFQLLLGITPDYSHLRVFGCLCYPNQTSTAAHKLSCRSTPYVLLGYPADHRGYRCLDLRSRRVITSRHVVFNETQFPYFPDDIQTTSTTPQPATVPESPAASCCTHSGSTLRCEHCQHTTVCLFRGAIPFLSAPSRPISFTADGCHFCIASISSICAARTCCRHFQTQPAVCSGIHLGSGTKRHRDLSPAQIRTRCSEGSSLACCYGT